MKKKCLLISLYILSILLFLPVGSTAQSINSRQEKPLSILLLGIDTGSLGRTEQGRSDVIIVATLNPHTEKITLTSIPRDTYTEIVGYGINDKLNHAYAFGGPRMSVDSVNQLLEMTLDHYIAINMGGLENLIDALNGITVVPPVTFEISGFQFIEGEPTLLTGAMAVAYSRERYTSGGDYGRQERQREIIQATFDKLLEFDSSSNMVGIFKALGNNVETDLSLIQMFQLVKTHQNKMYAFETYQLTGRGEMVDGVWYDLLDEQELDDAILRIRAELQE